MRIRPLHNNVLLSPNDPPTVTKGGIHLPASAKGDDVTRIGTVLAVGPGAINDRGGRDPIDVAIGHRVIYTKFAGVEIEVNGEKAVLLPSDQICGVLE